MGVNQFADVGTANIDDNAVTSAKIATDAVGNDELNNADAFTFNGNITITSDILDTNGNEQLVFTSNASAVNHPDIANAAAGNAVEITTAGDDTNIDLVVTGKGTGGFVPQIPGDSGSGPLAIGGDHGSSVGDESVAIGKGARTLEDTAGTIANNHPRSTVIGFEAGNNTGSGVFGLSVFGYFAARNNTGSRVTASGYRAAQSNTGSNVTANGYQAAKNNTKDDVTAVGVFAVRGDGITASNMGTRVTGIGSEALRDNTGDDTIGLGYNAGGSNTGNDSVFIGRGAGENNSTASQFILAQTDVNATPLIQGDFSTAQVGIGKNPSTDTLEAAGTVRAEQGPGAGTAIMYRAVDTDTSDEWRVQLDGSGRFVWQAHDSSVPTTRDIFRIDPSQSAQLDVLGVLGLSDGSNVALGTTTGTKIGTGTSQKIGFFNATPVTQQTAPASLTNNMTSTTTDDALEAVGDTSAGDESAPIERNFTELKDEIDQIRTVLTNLGLAA